ICSSVNRLFFMTSFSPLEAILSSFNWSENSRAGQVRFAGLRPPLTRGDAFARASRYPSIPKLS
ncbi:hypothetical protein, partial [Burkholderia pseudomallei]|uniref:hypothetical protein n=1 Tax=Burkholderia pseudomallei TaxID=28450 RepID=UPI001C82A622